MLEFHWESTGMVGMCNSCGFPWIPSGIPVEFQGNSMEIPLESEWNSNGIRVEFQWNLSGIPMEFESNSHGLITFIDRTISESCDFNYS